MAKPNITISKKKSSHLRKDQRMLLLLTVPAILYFFIFHYLPMFGVVMAFKDYRYDLGILGSEWIGLRNFEFFFSSQDIWRLTRNTVGYSSLFIVLGTAAAIGVALLLFEIRKKSALKYYQTTMILPYFLSWVIVGYMSYSLLNPNLGVLNQLLKFMGMEPVAWYSNPELWPYLLVFAHIWKSVGLGCIMYYAALMGVDPEYYEAATIDGANRWKQTWHISIPSITPVITILVILAIGDLFRGDFGLFYQIPRDVGVLYSTTDVIDTYVYRGLRSGEMAITAAVGLFQSTVGLVLILLANFIVTKINKENALF